MRKLKLQVQMTVDGFIAGPNGEMDWMTFNWDDALNAYVQQLTDSMDCIVLGRKLAQGFIPHWSSQPALEGADAINAAHKVVFTQTLEQSDWPNTALATGDLVDQITALKEQPGKDIIVYGGATFVSNLIENDLIDEYHLLVNPAAIGSGMPIFNKVIHNQPLTLIKSNAFDCGIVVLHYEPKRSQ